MKIGVISDTHGLLREEVAQQLQSCDHVIHAGDIGDKEIVDNLKAITETTIVRGNNDKEDWAKDIREIERIRIDGVNILVIHEIKLLPRHIDDVDLIIYGHSHKYSYENLGNITFFNPGSCGKKRFSLPLTMAIINIYKGKVDIEKINI